MNGWWKDFRGMFYGKEFDDHVSTTCQMSCHVMQYTSLHKLRKLAMFGYISLFGDFLF